MGNVGCTGKQAGLDSLCVGRATPEFIAPNTEHVTYSFNYTRDREIRLAHGQTGLVYDDGFPLDPQMNDRDRRALKWYVLKEYTPSAAQLRLNVSGRAVVLSSDLTLVSSRNTSACAFKICTRGRPVYDSIRTNNFTHTAHVVTAGVFFALHVVASAQGIFLAPRLAAVLENGDEVLLVDDQLGPLNPQSYYVDFALLDDGGRNVQVDLIFRGLPGEAATEDGSMRTLRTCLQDYIVFNSQVAPASISFCSSALQTLLSPTSVHLQHLQVSEERFEEPVAQPQPYDIWKEGLGVGAKADREKGLYAKLLYEGEDAFNATAATAVLTNGAGAGAGAPLDGTTSTGAPVHPQLQPLGRGLLEGDGMRRGAAVSYRESLAESCTEDFWHHVRYDNEPEPEESGHLRGEFWLSKHAVDKKSVYFHCSSNLAQATTMCIAFRFSCPMDYLQLIERAGGGSNGQREAVTLLRDGHIPASGIVLGIEHDPRHQSLLRMFVEYRNEIKDDMVLCECSPTQLFRSIAHQEVYDGGGSLMYRVTLLHSDGGRQSAVLQMNADDFEETNLDSARSFRMDEPTPRFPISPCPLSQTLSPATRVFVYSSVVYEQPEDPMLGLLGSRLVSPRAGSLSLAEEESWISAETGGTAGGRMSLSLGGPGPGGPGGPSGLGAHDCSHMSDATVEDWQSAGGGWSDGDCDGEGHPDTHRSRSGRGDAQAQLQPSPVKWRRPLIESAVLLSRMEEPPFKVFPVSLS